MRVDLALIVCGNGICEVITATLGPLPLDQLPKSKPVTPYAVFTDDTAWRRTGKRRPHSTYRHMAYNMCWLVDIPPAHARLRPGPGTRKPLRALAVAEDAPAGV